MHYLSDLLARQPMLPFIRESDYAVRTPWYMPERRLLDYLLIYIQEGECLIVADGTEYRFTSGEFCLLQPGCLHTLQGLTNTITPFAHLDIFYNPEREKSFPTRSGQIDLSAYAHLMQPRLNDIYGIEIPIKFTPSQPIRFRDTMKQIVQASQNRSPISQIETQCLASDLILSLLKDYTKMSPDSLPSPISFNWITSYFSYHLAEKLSVADMAKRANLSPSRFSAVFRQHFGMAPHQYLQHLRIQHASDLLATTNRTLQEIAEYCGFSDIHHFSKAFKKSTGQSPGSYRFATRKWS